MNQSGSFLRLRDIHVGRRGAPRPQLDCFSLTMAPGEAVVLLGEAGCGKEALMRALSGVPLRGDEIGGTLQFGETEPERAGRRLSQLRVAYLTGPRACPLYPNASVLSQLVRILSTRLDAPRSSARAELELVLGRMPAAPTLTELDKRPAKLDAATIAWGLFATAFAQTPDLLLADHPLTGIEPVKMRAFVDVLKSEQKRQGFMLLYAAMGTEVPALLGGRMIVMRRGRVVEEGPLSRLSGAQAHAYTRMLLRDRAPLASETPRTAGRGEPVLQIYDLELPSTRHKSAARPRDRLTFELRRGAALALVGEDGSGRHALARRIIGLERVRSGRVVLDAVDIGILSETMLTRLRRRVAYITGDDHALDPRMTIADTVSEPLRAHLGLPRDIISGYREAALKRVGLASLPGTRPVATLSPFDKRRLQVARAIVTAPLLAVLDEPLSGLDAFAQSVMRDLLRVFRAEEGPALLLITSDFSVARSLAETAFVFKDGAIVERGPIAEMMSAPKDISTRTLVDAVRMPETPSGGLS
ncbi:MAG: ATP-binding cassette domain-containing protein [Alphaproteobacteria bacterium]|nr:ATP-binding cassette domain-containing protein [Alphaproteobacteria bacterium]MDE2074780.1 ATP-binding cassette domain-containing protein [Alphaproteobacteria bacterium]MDE2353069.1 ATP-binding cassette domain-containing protein [Alphaproteobacteria bacterium]